MLFLALIQLLDVLDIYKDLYISECKCIQNWVEIELVKC